MKRSLKNLLFAAATAVVWVMTGCQNGEILVDDSLQSNNLYRIEFGDAIPDNATRTSKKSSNNGTGFEAGDVMSIYGFQYNTDETVDVVFSNTAVTKQVDGTWTYMGTKYWNPGSAYAFYGIYPKEENLYTFNAESKYFTVPNFVVADAKADQVDLMIAKVNETSPVNTVDMVFNHLLSNVNFYFMVQDNFNNPGIVSYEVLNFEVTGLKGAGSYTQTGFDNNQSAVGTWSVDESKIYPYPTVTEGSIAKGEQLSLGDDLLMIPQALADDATVTLTYRTVYSDGTSSTVGPRTFTLNKVRGVSRLSNETVSMKSWEPNVRYNYYLAVNPSLRSDPTADYDGGVGGYTTPTANVKTLAANDPANPYNKPSSPYYKENNTEDFWYVDVDNEDGGYNPDVDYPILWIDLDGVVAPDINGIPYTTLEGVADKNRNGVADDGDNFDGDEVNYLGVADNTTLNPYHLDVILLDTDADGVADTPLQRDGIQMPPVIPYNADSDGSIDGDANLTSFVDLIEADDPNNPTPGDRFYYVDTDGNGQYDPEIDYPIIWKDIDADGKEEGLVDWNRNGIVDDADNKDGDHTDYNGNPDNAELNPEGVDVVLIEDPDDYTNIIELERDPKIPYNCEADWNASIGGDKVVSGNVVYTDVNDPDTYMIDIDGDEVGDYKVVWEDIDGDGKLEGGVDRDGDGHIDDVDQDGRYMTVVPSTNVEDRYHKDPSDPTTTSAHVGKDVVLLHTDTNGDGKVDDNEWKQMEWPSSGPDIVVWGNADYDGATKGYQKPYDRYVVVDNFEFIDINKNGKYDDTVDYPIVWQDLDGTVYTNRANGTQFTTVEGIADINRNGKVDAGDRVDNDGKDYEGNLDDATHNPNHLDVIMLDYTGDHFAETPLSKKVPVPIDLGTEIRFTADVDAWISNVNGVKPIGN